MTSNQADLNNKDIKQSAVNNNAYKDEIELRDLIMILWNRKIMIIAITLIFALLAGIYSKFFIVPTYSTRFSLVINIPEFYNTKYGDYSLPIKTSTEYINLIKSNEVIRETIEDLGVDQGIGSISSRISFEEPASETQRIFHINVSGSTPEDALTLANALYENYIEYIDVMMMDRAVNHYYNDFSVRLNQNEAQIESDKDLLERQIKLMESTPKTIDQKSALEEIPNTNDYIILENIINPNYTEMEYRVLEIQQNINLLENENELYFKYLEELTAEKEKINEYYTNEQEGQFESRIADNMDIYRISEPILPSGSSSSNTMRNVVIAGLLGGMVSVFVAFFMAYWKREI